MSLSKHSSSVLVLTILILMGISMPTSFAADSSLLAATQKRSSVKLVQPLDSSTDSVAITKGAGTFISYFEISADWLFTVAVGFAVIWVVLGGFLIMLAGTDESNAGKGKSMIKWAIVGLLILTFAGYLLRQLNDIFYT